MTSLLHVEALAKPTQPKRNICLVQHESATIILAKTYTARVARRKQEELPGPNWEGEESCTGQSFKCEKQQQGEPRLRSG